MNGGRELPSSLVEGVVVLLTVEIDAEELRNDWFEPRTSAPAQWQLSNLRVVPLTHQP